MTVREAFEKAGHPVPEDAMLVLDYGKIAFLYGDKFRVTDNSTSRNIYRFETIKTLPESCGWIASGSRELGHIDRVDLSNLPAIDAIDALPEVVRKVVKP